MKRGHSLYGAHALCLAIVSVVTIGGCRSTCAWRKATGDRLVDLMAFSPGASPFMRCYYGMTKTDLLHTMGPPAEASENLTPFRHFRVPASGTAFLWRMEQREAWALVDKESGQLVELLLADPDRRIAISVLASRAAVLGEDLRIGIDEEELIRILGPPDRAVLWTEGMPRPGCPGQRLLIYDDPGGRSFTIFLVDVETGKFVMGPFSGSVLYASGDGDD